MKRILVTGSRDWEDRDAIFNALAELLDQWGHPADAVLVSGAARSGADRMAEEIWENFLGYEVDRHPANWRAYGKRAGFVRNEEMVNLGADVCLAFLMPCSKDEHADQPPHPSHGGDHTATLAEQAGIETRRITP